MTATARFSLDGGFVPLSTEIGGLIAGDRANVEMLITGFDTATDALDQCVLTAKVNLTDADDAPTSLQWVLIPGNPVNGNIVEYEGGATVLAQFGLVPTDTTALLQLRFYSVRVWVTRSGTTYDRTVQTGKIRSVLGATSTTGFVDVTIPWSSIRNTPTTIAGYGITDAYTQTQSNALYLKVAGDSGANLTNLSASALATGTVAPSRIAGAYTGITSVGTLGALAVTGAVTAGGFTGALTGNADTATKLSTARTFATTGDVTGSVSSDLTSGASIATTLAAGVVTNAKVAVGAAIAYAKLALTGSIVNADVATGAAIAYAKLALSGSIVNADVATGAAVAYSKLNLAASIVNADIATGAAIADTKLAQIATANKVANTATTAASANTASAIVARDASGNFTAGTITAALTGNASTAGKLQTPVTINGVSFDGSTNITVTASAPAALAAGTYLTGGSYDGSVAATFAVDADSANTASKVVARDLNGDFAGRIISATTFSGALTGNASTATTLQTARTINGTSFNGSANITVTAAAGTLTGTGLNATVVASSLTSVGTLTSGAIGTGFTAIADSALATIATAGKVSNSATTAASANTASAIVARDVSGNFSAGTITASLTGNISGTAPAGSLTGTVLASNVVTSSLTTVGTIASGVWQGTAIGNSYLATITAAGKVANSATTATDANTASAIVARDASGNFTAGTVTATLVGAAPAGSLSGSTLAAGVTASSLTSVGTLAADLKFVDATYDIGKTGATRPRDGFFSRNLTTGGTVTTAGTVTATIGTITTSTPGFSSTATWNAVGTTFTHLLANVTDTASAAASLLADWQVGAASKFSVSKAGAVTAASNMSVATGAAYQINGTSVLNATTLGSGVTGSSLTSVGTLTAGAIGSGFTAIPNSALANSAVTVNGTPISLGASGTVTAAAGTLTGTTLNATVVSSSLTSVGTLTAGGIGSGFTAIADTYLATLSTAGKVSNSATTATSANTLSAIVARDGSGNFSAGTITAALTGNATTATTLATARAINGVNFDGSAAITVTAAAGTLSGTSLAATVVGSSLTSVGTIATGVWQGTGIANAYLANSSVTVNGTPIALGASGTVTAAAGTLTGTTLNATVVSSSLTSVGTLSGGAVPSALITAGTFGAGAYTFPGALAITGAFTGATTGAFSGQVTSTVGSNGSVTYSINATTGYLRHVIGNNSVNVSQWGVEGSTGGQLLTGSTAYDAVLFGTNGLSLAGSGAAVHLRISNAGAATFSGKVAVAAPAGDQMTWTSATLSMYLYNDGSAMALSSAATAGGEGIIFTPSSHLLTLRTNSSNAVIIASNQLVRFLAYGAGAATFDASGNITSTSDMRHKVLQGTFGVGLSELRTIDPILYKWNEASGNEMEHTYAGFSAQNLKQASEYFCGVRTDGILSMQDRAVLAACVNAIKELDARASTITALSARVAALEAH